MYTWPFFIKRGTLASKFDHISPLTYTYNREESNHSPICSLQLVGSFHFSTTRPSLKDLQSALTTIALPGSLYFIRNAFHHLKTRTRKQSKQAVGHSPQHADRKFVHYVAGRRLWLGKQWRRISIIFRIQYHQPNVLCVVTTSFVVPSRGSAGKLLGILRRRSMTNFARRFHRPNPTHKWAITSHHQFVNVPSAGTVHIHSQSSLL